MSRSCRSTEQIRALWISGRERYQPVGQAAQVGKHYTLSCVAVLAVLAGSLKAPPPLNPSWLPQSVFGTQWSPRDSTRLRSGATRPYTRGMCRRRNELLAWDVFSHNGRRIS